jgi:myosin-5
MSEKSRSLVFVKDKELAWVPGVQTQEVNDKKKGRCAVVEIWNFPDEQSIVCDNGRSAKGHTEKQVPLKEYIASVLPLQNVDNNGNIIEFPDMVELPYLHEAGILFNLKLRHLRNKPYTRTGDIIIAINPFQWFTDLYTEKKRTYYSNRIVWQDSGEVDPRKSMEPHVYETSSLVYKGLAFEKQDQSILVSGESGAGKTETVKICMNHIASVQRGPVAMTGDDSFSDPVVDRVLQSNPLLETFGNAKTTRNDNSSRFGKYLQLQFEDDAKNAPIIDKSKSHCFLAGSKCDVYLLEKNRITGHEPAERTYHVFYQMCAAPDNEKAFFWPYIQGKTELDFKYVGQSPPNTLIEGMTDEAHFINTKRVLELIEVKGDILKTLYVAVCGSLMCGNITFGQKGDDASELTSKDEANELANLIGVSFDDLSKAFTERTMKTRNETYKVPLKKEVAKESCDAFAKEIYNKLFLWLVVQINNATSAEKNYSKSDTIEYGVIGLLDIFGFESFKINRFEQLCINYANEKLQQKFTEDIFQSVQQEYEAEGIELAEISYDDNSDVLDLIESRGGLCAMLNEECVRPKGNDETFVNKALSANKNSPALIVNSMNRSSFGVHHYAGKVMYDAEGFVARNQDTLPVDLEECGLKSNNFIISKKPEEDEPAGGGGPKRSKSNLVGSTVWNKYKVQLASLMTNLRKTKSKYIRCVKPNKPKKANIMEHMSTVEQLRCAGVVAAVTITRSAFPNRLENETARLRFASMWDKAKYPVPNTDGMSEEQKLKAECEVLFTCALKEREEDGKQAFVCGKTRTYFRAGALEFLEANRAAGMDGQAVMAQKIIRGFLVRKKFAKLLNSKAEEERLAREAADREAREAAEKAAKEQAEAELKRQQEAAAAMGEKQKLQNEIDTAEQEKNKKLMEIKLRLEEAKTEAESLLEQTSSEAQTLLLEPKKQAAAHKSKIEVNTKEIEYLQKENKKIKKEHSKVKKKFDELANNNKKLMEQNEKAGGLFGSENDGAVSVHKKNEMLQEELEVVKKDHKQLKEDVQAKQKEYMNTAEARLEFQKTMARILNLIQDNCKDVQLIEDTVCLAFDCERESKIRMAGLEAEFG